MIILCSFAIRSSILTINGCDFIQLHFEALNDRDIYFQGDPEIGLGLRSHEEFLGKNVYSWENTHKCMSYNNIETGMFLDDTELYESEHFYSSGINFLIGSTTVIALDVMLSYFMPNVLFYVVLHLGVTTVFIAARLQHLAFEKLNVRTGICDPERYFHDEWYEKYPLHEYPEYRYMKFFAECKLGETSKHALDSIQFQYAACIWIVSILGCTGIWYLLRRCVVKKDEEYNSVHIFSPHKNPIQKNNNSQRNTMNFILSRKKKNAINNLETVNEDDDDDDDDDATITTTDFTVVTIDDTVTEQSVV